MILFPISKTNGGENGCVSTSKCIYLISPSLPNQTPLHVFLSCNKQIIHTTISFHMIPQKNPKSVSHPQISSDSLESYLFAGLMRNSKVISK